MAERRGELALMQSLGAPRHLLDLGVALEAAVTLTASWLLALPLTEIVTRWMAARMGSTTGQPVQGSWALEAALLWLAVSALCALVASIAPAISAARTSSLHAHLGGGV